jgi:hypothetical protein
MTAGYTWIGLANGYGMGRRAWRALVITHRYLGIAIGLLMLAWFGSGVVMMYVAYPELSRQERLAALSPIEWRSCCALDALNLPADSAVRGARIEMVAGAPVLMVRPEGQPPFPASLTGKGGRLRVDFGAAWANAADAAERIFGRDLRPARYDLIDRDQWTVGEDYTLDRPLYRFRFDDPARTEIYVSSATGEVVLWTTAAERFWNWLGSVPHWLYFTEVRQNGALWTQVIIWTSVAGGFLTIMGLVLGVLQFRRGRSGTLSPYRGWFYWHHLSGLVFGLFTLTWVVSGTLSVNPWGLLETERGGEALRLAGEPLSWGTVKASIAALRANPPAGAVAITAAPLDGRLFWIAQRGDDSTLRLDAEGRPAPMPAAELASAAARIADGKSIAERGLMESEDAYYFAAGRERAELVLPVYRVVLNDADHTRYYLDPANGQLLKKIDSGGRGYRWWFDGLHRLDFTAAMRARPVWDAIMLILLAGGIAITGTGVYLAVRRLKRDLGWKSTPRAQSGE